MLVLSHKQGSKILVEFNGQSLVMEVKKTGNGAIQIAYDAPKSVGIKRLPLEKPKAA